MREKGNFKYHQQGGKIQKSLEMAQLINGRFQCVTQIQPLKFI